MDLTNTQSSKDVIASIKEQLLIIPQLIQQYSAIQIPQLTNDIKEISSLKFKSLYSSRVKTDRGGYAIDRSSFFGYQYNFGSHQYEMKLNRASHFDPFPHIVTTYQINECFTGNCTLSPKAMRNDITPGMYNEGGVLQVFGQYVAGPKGWVVRNGRWYLVAEHPQHGRQFYMGYGTGFADYDMGILRKLVYISNEIFYEIEYDSDGYCSRIVSRYGWVDYIVHYSGPRLSGNFLSWNRDKSMTTQLLFNSGSLIYANINFIINSDQFWFPEDPSNGGVILPNRDIGSFLPLLNIENRGIISSRGISMTILEKGGYGGSPYSITQINQENSTYVLKRIDNKSNGFQMSIEFRKNGKLLGPVLKLEKLFSNNATRLSISYYIDGKEVPQQQWQEYIGSLERGLNIFSNVSVQGVSNIIRGYFEDVDILNYNQQVQQLIRKYQQ